MTFDDLDGRLLDRIQSNFPLDPRPFKVLAEELGASEEEIIERVKRLEKAKTIRRIGPVFEAKRLGFTSTLCAAKVDPKSVDAVAEFINSFHEVTHNYLREHEFNVWFTLTAPSEDRIGSILWEIERRPGVVGVLSLPSEETYKINVHFKTSEDGA